MACKFWCVIFLTSSSLPTFWRAHIPHGRSNVVSECLVVAECMTSLSDCHCQSQLKKCKDLLLSQKQEQVPKTLKILLFRWKSLAIAICCATSYRLEKCRPSSVWLQLGRGHLGQKTICDKGPALLIVATKKIHTVGMLEEHDQCLHGGYRASRCAHRFDHLDGLIWGRVTEHSPLKLVLG